MRQFVLATAIAASFVAAPVFATETAPKAGDVATSATVKDGKPAEEDPNRIVCKREHVVGSNRPQKVCMTVAERERLKDAVSERLRNNRGADYNTTIGGPGR